MKIEELIDKYGPDVSLQDISNKLRNRPLTDLEKTVNDPRIGDLISCYGRHYEFCDALWHCSTDAMWRALSTDDVLDLQERGFVTLVQMVPR